MPPLRSITPFCLLIAVLPVPAVAAETAFSDAFSGDLQKWEQTGGATIAGGYLQIPTSHSSIRNAAAYGPWEDFYLEADFRITTVAAGFVIQRQNDQNYLLWQFNAGSQKFRPHQLVNGSFTVLKEVPVYLAAGIPYHVRMECIDGVVTTWLDGELLDETVLANPAPGYIGFRTGNSESFEVDLIQVDTVPIEPPPPPPPPPPPAPPSGLTAAPGFERGPGVWIYWEDSLEDLLCWELALVEKDAPGREIQLSWPTAQTTGFIPLPDSQADWSIMVRAIGDGGASDWTAADTFAGETPAPGFDRWLAPFLPAGIPPWQATWESDTDADSLPAGIEYLLDRDPALPDFIPVIDLHPEGGGIAVQALPSLQPDSHLAVYSSTDFTNWTVSPSSFTQTMNAGEKLFMKADAQTNNAHWLEPYGLRVSLLRPEELVRITDPVPMLSWSLRGAGTGRRQTKCEVLIATDAGLLAPGSADVWSSGMVVTGQPRMQVPSGVLSPNEDYWWTVRLWNEEDDPSAFTEPATFTTGNLSASAYTSRPPQVQTIVEPVKVVRNGNGNIFVDFGKAAFGTFRFKAAGAVGGEPITIHMGEKQDPGDVVDRTPGGTIRYRSINTSLRPETEWRLVQIPIYASWPDIADMPAHIGNVMPFRFVEIEGIAQEPENLVFEQLAVHTPWDEEASAFESSDDILNQVWDLCKYSIKATTFAAVYVDGDRERIPYEADAYINQLAHYGCEPAYALARFSHEYLLDHPTWPTEWKHHSILMAWQDWLYTGDKRSLEKFYAKLQSKLFPGAERADQLINPGTRDIVDWPYGERDGYQFRDYNTVVNAFQYICLRHMAEIATVLEKPTDAATYTSRADTLYDSFNTVFWDDTNRRYIDGEGTTHAALHANFFPLAFGLVPEDRKADVIAFVNSRGMACSVYGAHHLLEGLFLEFEAEAAVNLMRSTLTRSWYNMIRVGSTITLEAWDQAYKSNLDWNHAWGAAPAAAIPRFVLGVRPAAPGFASILIQPQPGPLEWIKGRVPTTLGPVELSLVQETDCLTGTVSTPPGAAFTLDLPVPVGAVGVLTLSGEGVPAVFHAGRVTVEDLPPGSYTFEVR